MKVLIVRIGAMGDVLHAMPAVAALRERHPRWFIGWAIEPRWSDLLQISGDPQDLTQGVVVAGGAIARQGLVDRWYSVPAGAWSKRPLASGTVSEILALRRTLRAERFDLCVDMQGALKSAVVGGFARAKSYAGAADPRERMARHWYGKKIDVGAAHVVEQGCELLGGAAGETLAPARVTLPMNERAEQWADETVGQERFVLISPGGGWGSKVWPAERLGRAAAELGRVAGVRTVVNASGSGSREADDVVKASQGFARTAPCSVGQLIALTRRAAVVVGGDTGPLHLAAALERPVVGIYGPTDPARNGPYGTRSRVLRDAESVTSHKRRHEVEAGMLKITVEEVVEAAREMLG
ncbi:MAG TPA: glycosyltransferase family 9 protein [Acidobacteriaceae bacterium]